MAGWRQAVALAMTGEEIEALTALSRSRTEPAGQVSRAAMLLGYREKPSFFAVGRRLGVASSDGAALRRASDVAYGALAALDDRPRPGKEPTITPEAKAWLVSLACDKAKEHGYPHELWTTRLLARHARERGPAAGHQCLARLAQGTRVQASRSSGEEIKPHKVRYYLERRDAEFEPKMAEVLCVYREVQVLKKAAAKAEKSSEEAGRDRLLRRGSLESRYCTSPRRHRILRRQCQAAMRASRGIHEYKRHGTRSSLLAGIDPAHPLRQGPCTRPRPPPQPRVHRIPQASRHRLSGAHRYQADPRQSFRTHLARNQSLARCSTARTFHLHLHAQARLLAQPHRGLLLQIRTLRPQTHPRGIKARTQGAHHGRHRRRQSPSRHPHLVLQACRGRLI